jgi:hypothetical protein
MRLSKVSVLMGGIVLTAAVSSPAMAEQTSASASKFQRDRQAILDMAGQYEVDFRFYETVPIKAGYETKEPYQSGAHEMVKVIEDEGERIVLQRLLVVGEGEDQRVVKHWRQTWQYEPEMIYAFRGNLTWQPRRLSEQQADGKWAETVFQVDDSPRYAGLGDWTHRANLSHWQSGETWRPLPRRERKRADEYDVLVTRNRYTQTPFGWAHEQDSYKLVLDDGEPAQVLTREVGLNRYQRTDEVDFSAAKQYWQRTDDFWQQVRNAWQARLAKGRPIRMKATVGGQRLWHHMFEQAEAIDNGGDFDRQAAKKEIDQTLSQFLIGRR